MGRSVKQRNDQYSGSQYPPALPQIARGIKASAGWKCVRCGHAHEPKAGYTLTVHHLDMNKSNLALWNLAALCQRCHLSIQSKVDFEQVYMFEHTGWMKLFVEGFMAAKLTGVKQN